MAIYARTRDAGSGNIYARTSVAGGASLGTPAISAITTLSATVTVSSDTAGGTLYLVVTPLSGTPTAAQIKAGQGPTGAAALYATSATAVSGANVFSGVSGLSAGVTYYVWAIQNNGVDSGVVNNSFTTTAGMSLSDVNTTNTIVSAATGNIANGANLASVVSGTLNYSTLSQAITSIVAASTTVTFTAPTIWDTQLPFTDVNHTAVSLRVTDGTNNAQINLATSNGLRPPAGFTVYPVSAALGQYGTDSAYQNVPAAPANNDQSVWPATGSNGWTITPEVTSGVATGRFSISGGTGSTTTFTIYYRRESTATWYSTAVTYNFNTSANITATAAVATSGIAGPLVTVGTSIDIVGVEVAAEAGDPIVDAEGSVNIIIVGVSASGEIGTLPVQIAIEITPDGAEAVSAVELPSVDITGGTSSGTTNFRPTVLELLEEAWERATGGQEMRTGYQLRTARRSFNFLTLDWQNRGYNFWTLREANYTVQAGQTELFLPMDVMDLSDMTVTQNNTDIALRRITMSDYIRLAIKDTRGLPTQMVVLRTATQITVRLWPVPDATYVMKTYELRRIQDAGTAGTVADIPYRFIPALVAGLAYHIAGKLPGEAFNRVPMLQAQYNDAFAAAAEEDRDKGSLFISPMRTR